jgi:hypothetical protein
VHLLWVEFALHQHEAGSRVEQHRDTLVVSCEQRRIIIDVDDLERNAAEQPERVLTEVASLPGHERKWVGHDASIVAAMRPFTAFVVIGLVVLILGAFVIKLATTGLAP